MKNEFITGQRWLSEAELELGLGSVVSADAREVQLYFASREVTRQYARESAPLRRVRFNVGDQISSRDGQTMIISEITEDSGLLVYRNAQDSIAECDLSETMDFSSPEDRLAIGQIEPNSVFNLRFLANQKRSWLESLPIRGLLGARISLLPHQLYVSSEVANRYHTRVLLGDEVGLGKTIEAGLVLHRQLLTGICSRVLILLPESLTHQWFLELWRRFNLVFSLFDEERCRSVASNAPNGNPFLDNTTIICSIDFLVGHPSRAQQVIDAGWDTLVVDEAHHLSWKPGQPSAQYQLIEELTKNIPTVLLLSGTPEQLGEMGHFARLHLLDPKRFHDLQKFQDEQDRYTSVASVVDKLLNHIALDKREETAFCDIFRYDHEKLVPKLKKIQSGNLAVGKQLVEELVDHHGTGRLFYRNKRSEIAGFPKRSPVFYRISLPEQNAELYDPIHYTENVTSPEFQIPKERWDMWWQNEPRIQAVLDILEKNPHEKILIICARAETVQAIQAGIEQRVALRLAVFHEGLSLVVRDRNAAYFADPEGARLLICSEIGSEGRNFQFCHHLILFDLPPNPELLEQRIGRLDRIGQKNDIIVHVLILTATVQEVFSRWYNEGLDAFRKPVQGANKLYESFSERVRQIAIGWANNQNPEQLQNLIDDTIKEKDAGIRKLAAGRDRLLDFHSHRPEIGKALVDEIEEIEAHSRLDIFMEELCQQFGIQVEDHDHNSLILQPGDAYQGLPGLTEEGLVVTFSRQRALAREDITFLTWEHPMVIGAMDQLLGSLSGRTSYGVWKDPNSRSILLEAVFLVHCLAPEQLRPERFLPPTPLRILVNHKGEDLSAEFDHDQLKKVLIDDSTAGMLQNPEVTQQLLPSMVKRCRELAEEKKQQIIHPALAIMKANLEPEIDRLETLLESNAPVRQEEIQHLQKERMDLESYFVKTTIRLDAVRFIWRGPV